jgi:hypothetical protein
MRKRCSDRKLIHSRLQFKFISGSVPPDNGSEKKSFLNFGEENLIISFSPPLGLSAPQKCCQLFTVDFAEAEAALGCPKRMN